MLILILILKLLMLLNINDFLLLIIFELIKKSLFLISFYYIIFSTQLRSMLIVVNIVK